MRWRLRQAVLGALGAAVGVFVAWRHLATVEVREVSALAAGRWKGRYVLVRGRPREVGGMRVLVGGDGRTALRVEGRPGEEVRGRLRPRAPAAAGRAGYLLLPYVLDAGAGRVDAAGVAGLLLAAWGVLLVWAARGAAGGEGA